MKINSADRWDEWRSLEELKAVTVKRGDSLFDYDKNTLIRMGMSVLSDAPRERNKLYEQRDAWMGEYLFGKN